MNSEVKKPAPLDITSGNCLSIMTFLREKGHDSQAQLVMDMFMRITELEIEARVRAEMKPPRPTGMRGARPPGGWVDEARPHIFGGPHPEDTPKDPLRAMYGGYSHQAQDDAAQEGTRVVLALAAKYNRCLSCSAHYSQEGAWPAVECGKCVSMAESKES